MNNNRQYSLNEKAFDAIDNEPVAYWWGFLYADGCVYKNQISIKQKLPDKYMLENLRSFLQLGVGVREITSKTGYIPNKTAAMLIFKSIYMAARLNQLGVVTRRETGFTEAIKNLPYEFQNAWIRGYMDGNGSVKTREAINFVGRKELLEWIRGIFAKKIGTRENVALSRTKCEYIFALDYYLGNAIKVRDYLYDGATIWLNRKRDRAYDW